MSDEREATKPMLPASPTVGAIERSPAGTIDAWTRWLPLWHAAFYVLLVLATAGASLDPAPSWSRRGAFLGLAALLGLWYWARVVVAADRLWSRSAWSALTYFAVAFPLFVGLSALHPAAMFLAFAYYWQVYSFWPLRWAIPGSAVLTIVLWWRSADQGNGSLRPAGWVVVLFLVALVVSGLLSLYIDAIIRQSHDRQRLIDELADARQGLAAAERRAGVLAERQRLAGEIHDTLAQGFTSIVIHLETAEAALPADLATVHRHLDQARRAARDNLTEARRFVQALRPEALERGSLPDALARLTARWSADTEVVVEATVTGAPRPLSPEIEVTILRAAQEALNNIRRHAKACRVELTLAYAEDLVTFEVQDDGLGFDPTAASLAVDGRFGLTVMRERIEHLGGTLAIESRPGLGTTVAVAMPARLGVPVGVG